MISIISGFQNWYGRFTYNRFLKMKVVALLLVLLSSYNGFTQRYLTDEFPVLDSIIGGIYGTAINYQSNSQNLLFDFYKPANDVNSNRPLIIYLHGGGFNSGSRSYPSVQQICRRMANKGYTVANIDYRLDPSFDIYNSNSDRRAMTDAMHDAKQAIRYFKSNATMFGIDTSLIFIGGESAGAITSMMASYVDKQSEMNTYPLANPNNPIGSSSNLNVSSQVKGTLCLCGLILDTLAIELPTDPSILWTHGTNDNFIPISLALNIVLRANNIGLPFEAKAYQGATHCPWYFGNPNWSNYLDSTIMDITNFLFPQVVTMCDQVTNTLDSGVGSLREVIACNSNEIIEFDTALNGQTINLNSSIEIDKNITLSGAPDKVISITSPENQPAFIIMEGETLILENLNLFTNNNSCTLFINRGRLIIRNVTIKYSDAMCLEVLMESAEGSEIIIDGISEIRMEPSQ